MDKSEVLQQQIQASQQVLKTEIIVSEGQLDSSQGVKKIIKKYQARVSEMLRMIQRQKKQNESLKIEFKQLNEQLNNVLKKVQAKNRTDEEPKNVDNRLEIMKKQLENEIKKNTLLKKEIQQVKYKEKYLEGYKVDDLKNAMKQKDKMIQELTAKIKLYEKLDKLEKNGDCYKKQEELIHKIMQQNQQILHLKKKSQQAKKNEQQLQKNIKTLRQQINNVENKNIQKAFQSKPKEKTDNNISKQQYDKLNEKFKQLETAKKVNDRLSKQEIQTLTLKLKQFERDFQQLKEQVAKKEKQGSILMHKLREKQRKNFNTMQPIKTVRYSQQILHSNNFFENRKQFKGLTYGLGVYREFDDTKQLPIEKNYRIKKLIFTHFEEHILSLTTQYQILDAQIGKQTRRASKVIETFNIPSQYANIKTVQYTFSDYEYITNFQIYTLKSIELIRIATSKEQTIQVGNVKNLPKYKQQNFQIKNHEKPISFMGVIENKRIGGDNKEYLISLGLQIRRKQVFIRSKTNKKQETIYRRSMVSKSHHEAKEDS